MEQTPDKDKKETTNVFVMISKSIKPFMAIGSFITAVVMVILGLAVRYVELKNITDEFQKDHAVIPVLDERMDSICIVIKAQNQDRKNGWQTSRKLDSALTVINSMKSEIKYIRNWDSLNNNDIIDLYWGKTPYGKYGNGK
jgi:hypothetical protein